MSENENHEEFEPEDFAKFLQELLSGNGDINVEELAKIAGLPNDPATLQALVKQLQQAISQGDSQTTGGVNWSAASTQALTMAREHSHVISDVTKTELSEAARMADLWLDGATSLSALAAAPKIISREVWVQDALPLFQEIASPVAERVAKALTENLEENLPEELGSLAKGAGGIMRSAGGALFAMQLGNALGRLSQEVLSGGDIGLPFYAESRPALVAQNVSVFVRENELVQDQANIYLSVREIAFARLFKHSRWLRDEIISQITQYSKGIVIDGDKMRELATEITAENAASLRAALESGELLATRTESQLESLQKIEHLLALIEGWVDVVTANATKLLPSSPQIAEVIRRRRATGSPAQSTFGTLVGLELRPKRVREVSAFWIAVTESIGYEKRDATWDHPDLLPTVSDIDNIEEYLKRIQSTDELDQAIRDLLGE